MGSTSKCFSLFVQHQEDVVPLNPLQCKLIRVNGKATDCVLLARMVTAVNLVQV